MSALVIVLSLVFTVLTIALFAAVVRRLLGMQFGGVRTLLAGLVAFGLVSPIVRAIGGDASAEDLPALTVLWLFVLSVAVAVLVAMALLVLVEVLLPTGSIPAPLEWRSRLRNRMIRTRRYTAISRILARHGLLSYLRSSRRQLTDESGPELGRSLRAAFEDGGLTFVKLGQLLSTRPDLLPRGVLDELNQLQDQAAPAEWTQVRAILQDDLGRSIEEVFSSIDPVPLAAASVAQVHRAVLADGTEVVVKIQRPEVQAVVERDLIVLRQLARSAELRTSWGASMGVAALANGFAESLHEELDFRVEAANLSAVAASASDQVEIPRLYQALCSERVLVMQQLAGVPISRAPVAELAPAERQRLGQALLDSMLSQIFADGVFHADPHPGNILLLDDGRIGLLDFGSVGRLHPGARAALQQLVTALLRGDAAAACDALLEVMPRPVAVDEAGLERSLGRFIARHLGPGSTPDVAMFAQLMRIVSSYRLSIPPELAAVFRALATMEATLAVLSPGFDLVASAQAFSDRTMAAQTDPARLRQTVTDEVVALLPMLRRLPRRIDRIVNATEQGRLGMSVRLFADERDRGFVTDLLHRALLTVLAASTGLMAVLLLGTTGGPQVTQRVSLFQLLGYSLLVVSAVLALRVLAVLFSRRPG